MLRSYFKIAIRNAQKSKVYSLVNIGGLAIGLAVFWLIALILTDELSYDRYLPNADRIYRVVHEAEWPGGSFRLAPTAPPFAAALKKDIPGIEESARIDPEGGGTLVYQDKKIVADDILFADNSLLTIFQYPFLYGNPRTALSSPNSIVLTKSLAEKLFGRPEDALDKNLTFQNDAKPTRVTGVIEDIPANSHLTFHALRSWSLGDGGYWQNFYLYTYVLLQKNADAGKVTAALPGFADRYVKPVLGKAAQYRMELQPVTSIHLHSQMSYEIGRNGDIRYVYLFATIALLVLVIAVINYINLTTARSSVRVKEVGVRKVIGSGRRQLINLFLAESVLYTFLAAVIAVLLAGVLLPVANRLAGKELSIWQFGVGPTVFFLVLFSLLTGLTGGLYPALFLSGFRTIPALKGQQGNLQGTIFFRKSLVTFQFVITIVLITGSAILYQQLQYMLTRDMGFNKEQVLSFHISQPSVREHIEELKAQLLQNPSVEAVSGASITIGNNAIGTNSYQFGDQQRIDSATHMVQNFFVDADYLSTLQIRLAGGRNFSSTMGTDRQNAVLINETLVKELGWTVPKAVGKKVQFRSSLENPAQQYTIIGVVKDFNFYSLQHKITPLLLQMPPVLQEEDNLYVRVKKGQVSQALQHIEATYHRWDASTVFSWQFLDEKFSRQYASEEQQGRLLFAATGLAILIACLGLFGLVTFSVEQRTREIGIRKVLGASVSGIVTLISKDLIKPVGWAILIATPIAWWGMHRWLERFAYHTGISGWIFAGAGSLAGLIALLTVGLRAMRAARANPTKSLRTE